MLLRNLVDRICPILRAGDAEVEPLLFGDAFDAEDDRVFGEEQKITQSPTTTVSSTTSAATRPAADT